MIDPKNTSALTAASQETVRTIARLQSDLDLAKAENETLRKGTLDGLDLQGVVGLQQENGDLRAENVRLRAERDEVTAKMAYANSLVEFKNDVLTDRARAMLEVVKWSSEETAREKQAHEQGFEWLGEAQDRRRLAVAKLNKRGE